MKQKCMEFFYLQTDQLVEIRNPWIGLLLYSIQLIIVIYVIGIAIIYEREYQSKDNAIGTVMAKVKGISGRTQIHDSYDFVNPPLENDAVMVGVVLAKTKMQQRGVCDGNDNSEKCTSDADCVEGKSTTNGYTNGTCNINTGFCYIDA
eukprot:TRINITY_DN6137_c0_g1_i1.p1 TRINITY_DN6137_c0_g1~~TRINITY_DN6137_c0_g1_i1.p1  ORF type:complete len:148 (-),score=20.93 TRINITY_DN6137_c0_g1_i1:137-580(-)